jgi:hypothetical protein
MRYRPSGGTPMGSGIGLTVSFRSTKQILTALGSMPICTGQKVIFRMQLTGTDDLVTL